MGRLLLVGLLAFAVALAGTAYAEVQSIKVGGDIDLKAISHNDYDLKLKQKNEPGTTAGTTPLVSNDDNASFFLSTVHLNVDADLTDNVSTHVRLLNQRVWDAHSTTSDDQIDLDNAYVVLKEFLYSPLTVMAGRQDLNYGTGFIVGPGLLADPNGIFAGLDTPAIHAGGIGREHSAYNAYDAIRLILDFAPLTVEGLIAKINETGSVDDDQNLYGVVVNYKLDRWDAEVEPYWFYKSDEAAAIPVSDSRLTGTTARTYDHNRVHTYGLRLAGSPIENLRVNAEGAAQMGEMKDLTTSVKERKREGWGATVDARYNWVAVPWTPQTGIGWVFFSGEDPAQESGAAGIAQLDEGDTFDAWDVMYRGSFTTYIQDFFAGNDGGGLYTTFDGNDTSAGTNRHLLYGDMGITPMEDVNLWARWTQAWFAEDPRLARSSEAGGELDVKATYDYTEDVQLGVWGGWFFPGQYYDQRASNTRGNDVAWTVGGSANVKF